MNHQADTDLEKKNSVYYDGSCPMCTVIIKKINTSSKGGRFLMQDITQELPPQNLKRADIEKEIHVVVDGAIYKNTKAIFKILEEYPTWKPLVRIGKLPIIKDILPIGYNFIAANRHFLFGPASRIYWLKTTVSVGFIFGLLLSLKLWVSSRFYPLTPVLSELPPIPYPFDWLSVFIFFCLLLAIIVSAKPKPYIWASIIFVTFLVFMDQQRLQPWVYQYTFMLATLGLFSWKWNDTKSRDTTLNISRFIVASIYFWSGIQKINLNFMGNIFPWMISPVVGLFPTPIQSFFYGFGIFAPFIEIGIGVGLIVKKYRTVAIWGALVMCLFVLLTLGPLGHNWNSIIWPWNIVMVIMVLLLFTKTETIPARKILDTKGSVFYKFIVVVFGILPSLYFFNIWDSYVSWSLYSGTTNKSSIYLSGDVKRQLPDYVQQFVQIDDTGKNVLSISEWAFEELNVPPYPETRIFKNITKSVCATVNSPQEIKLVMSGRLSRLYQHNEKTLNCAQLD